MKLIATFTVPLSILLAFSTRFNPEFQEMAYREVKIGVSAVFVFFALYQFAKWDNKREKESRP